MEGYDLESIVWVTDVYGGDVSRGWFFRTWDGEEFKNSKMFSSRYDCHNEIKRLREELKKVGKIAKPIVLTKKTLKEKRELRRKKKVVQCEE